MSGNVTKTEFDDVLSSIRRLVSDKSSKDSETVKKDNDRFVLTPALRVLDDLKPVAEEEFASNSQAHQPQEAVAELEDPKSAQSPEYTAMAEAWNEELARVSSGQQAPIEDEPADVLPRPEVSLEYRIAELEEAVAQSADEWEPDGSEPEVISPPKRHIFEVVDNTKVPEADPVEQEVPEDIDELELELDEIASEASVDPVEDEVVDEVKDLADIAELEEVVENSDNVTPMFTHSAEPTGEPYLLSKIVPNTGVDRSSDNEDTPEFRHVSTAASDASSPNSAIVDNDDVFLDVEALRSMISDVVREELRGNMGESITRNLRRMVRQEIEVALLPKDSD